MAEIEIAISIVAPSVSNAFDVGDLCWHLGNSDITKIEAKLSSGSGTFNAKKTAKHSAPLGWITAVTSEAEAVPTGYWHLRADDLSEGTGISDGDSVETWESWPSNLSSFRQGVSGSQPEIKTALGPGDDTSTVHFDGSDDFLEGYQVGDGLFTIPGTSDFTAFIVIGDLPTLDPSPLIGRYDTGEDDLGALYGRDGRMYIQDNDENNKRTTSDIPAPDQIRCIQFDVSAEKVAERVDGDVSYSAADGPKNDGFTFNGIGAVASSGDDLFLEGGISEILLYPEYLEIEQVELIEGYLAHRWGLEGDLPAAHTYKSTNPFVGSVGSSDYINTSENITLDTTYTDCSTATTAIDNGEILSFYVPNCQDPGTLTIKITYTVD